MPVFGWTALWPAIRHNRGQSVSKTTSIGPNVRNLLKAWITLWLFAASLTAFAAGPNLDLAQYRGKVVYLDFWASWCPPCRQSFPWMNAMQSQFGHQGLVIVAVNVNQHTQSAIKFLKQIPASFKIVYDPKGKLAEKYNLIGMPSSFLIGRDGRIYYRDMGFRDSSPQKYEAEIRTLLAK